jgi:hypothetical protein
VATGDVTCRLFIDAVTKADDGMELPLYSSYFATSPEGLPDEKQLLADVRRMVDLLGQHFPMHGRGVRDFGRDRG